MQRVSIGHSVSVSNSRNSPKSLSSPPAPSFAGTFSTRFSMRMPQRPGRYNPGSMLVIMPGCIAMCSSGTTFEMLCGPSCTFRK